jgi:hypothetical protein
MYIKDEDRDGDFDGECRWGAQEKEYEYIDEPNE